jgi:hypothetical protein
MRTLLFCLLSSAPVWTGGNPYPTIGAIPLPAGYHRATVAPGSFGAWLRAVALKRTLTVYLYNGKPKANQDAQFAVLDVSVGHEDLQQCADAVMRLRAEYLYGRKEYAAITFYTERGVRLNFAEFAAKNGVSLRGDVMVDLTKPCFDLFLQKVFSYCSTRTLAKQLVPAAYSTIEPGDVLIRSGSPGHAMLVMDLAEDEQGRRIYMLAQSYMPAQDIHIVKNPGDDFSPWYQADSTIGVVVTPEYMFKTNELRKWPK